MHSINTQKTAIAFGILLGGWHALWSALVLLGIAQPIMDFVLWAHMIHIQWTVGPFEMTAAITLVVMTGAIGYVMGWVFAKVWNWLHASEM